ncbi:hypothetical protein [Metabacillus malikii]|uniref:DUF2306 domain-containing protein n=1 Tax=Metabacillus malikii TaxID=1504265 RepID=A0ABT9ZEN0_9BACI|nr:hypothetical protein [Metabacillus malikii]MDQ0230727.1 hypothetical protein [Metabacillus malikii]
MTYIQIGIFTIPSAWLSAILALFLVASMIRLMMKQKVPDWYWNGFFLYVLVWKLSYIFFEFSLFLDMPMSLIYFHGGLKGHILAIGVVTGYFIIVVRKRVPLLQHSIHYILSYFIFYQGVINLLDMNFVEGGLHLSLSLSLLSLKYKEDLKFNMQMILLSTMVELLLLSVYQSLFTYDIYTIIWLGFGLPYLLYYLKRGRMA